jgi:hypothetical protein
MFPEAAPLPVVEADTVAANDDAALGDDVDPTDTCSDATALELDGVADDDCVFVLVAATEAVAVTDAVVEAEAG